MRDAVKSGETGYPHTHVHEAATSAELVEGIEAAAGGSPAAAAAQVADSGLEPKTQVGRHGAYRVALSVYLTVMRSGADSLCCVPSCIHTSSVPLLVLA